MVGSSVGVVGIEIKKLHNYTKTKLNIYNTLSLVYTIQCEHMRLIQRGYVMHKMTYKYLTQ